MNSTRFDLAVCLAHAEALIALRRFEQAICEIDLGLACNSTDSSLWKVKAWALHQLGRSKESHEAAKNAVNANPRCGWAWCLVAVTSDRSSRDGAREAAYRKALELEPHNGAIHANWGIYLDESRRREDAESALRKALSLEPTRVSFHLLLARNRSRTSSGIAEAELLCQKALSFEPDNPACHELQGELHERHRRHSQAVLAYKESLRLDPSNLTVRGKLIALEAKLALSFRSILAASTAKGSVLAGPDSTPYRQGQPARMVLVLLSYIIYVIAKAWLMDSGAAYDTRRYAPPPYSTSHTRAYYKGPIIGTNSAVARLTEADIKRTMDILNAPLRTARLRFDDQSSKPIYTRVNKIDRFERPNAGFFDSPSDTFLKQLFNYRAELISRIGVISDSSTNNDTAPWAGGAAVDTPLVEASHAEVECATETAGIETKEETPVIKLSEV